MFTIYTLFCSAFVVSATIICVFLGIILASGVVTTGLTIIDVKLSPFMRKVIVLLVAASAGYLGMVWALTRV